MKPPKLFSWLNINSCSPSETHYPRNSEELKTLLKKLKQEGKTYQLVGSNHSYNGIQLVDDQAAIVFDGSGLNSISYDYESCEVTVECGVTVEELKIFLMKLGRQLPTSGNYMKQKVVGALLTGTHGYGFNNALMADSVKKMLVLDEDGNEHEILDESELILLRVSFGCIAVVLSVMLETVPLIQYRVKQDLFPMNELKSRLETSRNHLHGLALFPYSRTENPSVGMVVFERLDHYIEPTKVQKTDPLKSEVIWLVIKLFWNLDRKFPWSRPMVQRLVTMFEPQPIAEIITSPDDIDYFYDYSPLRETQKSPDITRQIFEPKYTANNIAMIIQEEDLAAFLEYTIVLIQEYRASGNPKYIKDMIGIRYIGQSTKSKMAGNYLRKSYAVDLFFEIADKDFAFGVQKDLASKFQVRPHFGKTRLSEDILKNLPKESVTDFIRLREKYNKSGLLRPNVPARFLTPEQDIWNS